jgi:hypothetical protein
LTATLPRLIDRDAFCDAIGDAVLHGTGYAAGKLGVSERAWLSYPIVRARAPTRLQLRAFEQSLRIKATFQSGVFPADPGFYADFAAFYADRLRDVDCIGLDLDATGPSLDILRFHSIAADLLRYTDQEPDRSSPAADERCYLPHFAGRRVLLVCPFAEALRARATKETFEAVWAKTGKRWFAPAAVEAVEFPYGFARETQERYGTCLDLLGEIESRIDGHDFDVALIAAGALGVPVASHVRAHAKVGLSLGGALQALFGVIGDRWRASETWQQRYINPAWIDVPPKYRPRPGETIEDYW